jgi:uroporphyrin-3 C-methyltransferase
MGLAAWQWYESRIQRPQLDQEFARRLGEAEAAGREARGASAQLRNSLRDVDGRLGQLEARAAEAQNQRSALETLYQELLRNRDELILAEVEQILLIASQQLQLAGNVKAALIALEAADARLAQSDRPQFTPLRRVIGQDAERLRKVPVADVTGIGLKIERLLDAVDSLPLVVEARPAEAAADSSQTDSPAGWRRMLAELKRDLGQLVRVQRLDAPAPVLLAPEQAFFLRENLKLRLLAARLALLSRDGAAFRSDLSAAASWTKLHFDGQSDTVKAALASLAQLGQTDLAAQPPDIDASLEAVRNIRLVREPGVR